jgi:hypothetical protein
MYFHVRWVSDDEQGMKAFESEDQAIEFAGYVAGIAMVWPGEPRVGPFTYSLFDHGLELHDTEAKMEAWRKFPR